MKNLLTFQHTYWFPVISGVLLALTLPQFGISGLALIALVPLILFATKDGQSAKRLIVGALVFGTMYDIAVTFPLMRVTAWWWLLTDQSSLIAHQVYFAARVCFLAIVIALIYIPAIFAFRRLGSSAHGALTAALFFAALEWLRAHIFLLGFSWGAVGYALVGVPYVKFFSHLFGVFGLSVLVVGCNLLLAQLIRIHERRETHGLTSGEHRGDSIVAALCVPLRQPNMHAGIWCIIVLLTFSVCYGAYHDHILSSRDMPALSVRVIGTSRTTNESFGEGAYREYRGKLAAALAESPDLVVLPENALPYFEISEDDSSLIMNAMIPLVNRSELYEDFLSLSRANPATTIAVGLHTRNGGMRHNSIVYFKNGAPETYYHKRQLVPFAEYAPYPFRVPIVVRFFAGDARQYAQVNGVNTTGTICSEIGDTSLVLSGASIIIAPSNDGVFESPSAALVHERMARMRAIENGAYVLRANKGGVGSIIGPDGGVLARGEGEVLEAEIYPNVPSQKD